MKLMSAITGIFRGHPLTGPEQMTAGISGVTTVADVTGAATGADWEGDASEDDLPAPDVTPQAESDLHDHVADDSEEELPANLAKAYARLRTLRDTADRLRHEGKKAEYRAHMVKVHALEEHIAKLQNPTQPVVMDANDWARMQAAANGLQERQRSRLARLEADAASNATPFLPEIPIPSEPLSMLPKDRLLADPTIRAGIARFAAVWRGYVMASLRNEDILFPKSRQDRLRRELMASRSEDEMRALRDEIALIESSVRSGSSSAAASAARTVIREKLDAAKLQAGAVLVTAESLLERWRKDAVAAESAWAARYGVARKQTEVSARIVAELAKATSTRRGLAAVTPQQAMFPFPSVGVGASVIESYFGLTFER